MKVQWFFYFGFDEVIFSNLHAFFEQPTVYQVVTVYNLLKDQKILNNLTFLMRWFYLYLKRKVEPSTQEL